VQLPDLADAEVDAEVLLGQRQHFLVTAVGPRFLASLDVIEELVGQISEIGIELLLPAGVTPPKVLQQLVQLVLGDAGIAVEVVALAANLGTPEAARSMEIRAYVEVDVQT
jgi:hypothetical protein